jgi:hypothetical protein
VVFKIPMMATDSTEALLIVSRRAFVVLLLAFVWLGATCLAIAFFPGTILAQWPMHWAWVFPVAMTFAYVALRTTLRGSRWNTNLAESKTVMSDEFRQSNLLRAQRAAFVAVLVLQVPLALAVIHLPTTRAIVALAGTTITFGPAVLVAVFLYLDRE